MEGYKRSVGQADSRLPITRQMLFKIVQILQSICSSNYETKLFRAAFATAFFCLFRAGELTVWKDANHTVQLKKFELVR